jgi:hypothetical protein
MAWRYLGTEERMRELGTLMAKALAVSVSETERERVALFKEAIWDYMTEGRRKYLAKAGQQDFVEKLRNAPLPKAVVPRCPASGGKVEEADFSNAVALEPWYHVLGYQADRSISARAMHDGEFLYLALEDHYPAAKLVRQGGIWNADDWELFFAAQRDRPYRQLGINPAGQHKAIAYGESDGNWRLDARVRSTPHKERWIVLLALPLAQLAPGGVKPGTPFYANFVRGTKRAGSPLAWSAHFEYKFHRPDRLGELVLE